MDWPLDELARSGVGDVLYHCYELPPVDRATVQQSDEAVKVRLPVARWPHDDVNFPRLGS
jgi:hypothetical protein